MDLDPLRPAVQWDPRNSDHFPSLVDAAQAASVRTVLQGMQSITLGVQEYLRIVMEREKPEKRRCFVCDVEFLSAPGAVSKLCPMHHAELENLELVVVQRGDIDLPSPMFLRKYRPETLECAEHIGGNE